MPKKVELIYQFNGPAVQDGIDVFKLSPLLLSIGELLQKGQTISHPEGHPLGVNIKPFKQGSFVIEIALFAQNNLQQLLDLVNSDSVQEIKEVLEWMGIIAGTTGGVIGLYKFLKGQPKRFEEVGPDEVRVTAQDDSSITVNKKTFALFQNSEIQQNIYNIYGNFLGQEGIETVDSYIEGSKQTAVKVSKADVPHFNPANTTPTDTKEDEKRNITRIFLKPKRVSLEGEPDNWSLRKGKDVVVTATIRDEEFLRKIKTGDIRLSKEDTLEVDLLEIQTIVNDDVNTKYEVLKIVNYRKANVQQGFFDQLEQEEN